MRLILGRLGNFRSLSLDEVKFGKESSILIILGSPYTKLGTSPSLNILSLPLMKNSELHNGRQTFLAMAVLGGGNGKRRF